MKLSKFIFTFFLSTIFLGCASQTISKSTQKSLPLEPGTCVTGTTRQGYTSPTTNGDIPCLQGTQICASGEWQGPMLFTSCDNFTKSCGGSPHGTINNGYLQQTSPNGVPCTQATQTCVNGTWSGPEVYSSCSEL